MKHSFLSPTFIVFTSLQEVKIGNPDLMNASSKLTNNALAYRILNKELQVKACQPWDFVISLEIPVHKTKVTWDFWLLPVIA